MPRREKRDWSRTWFGVSLARVGFRKTAKVMEFALAWAIVTADLKRPPANIEEYAAWWKVGVATGYREQSVWREAWPEYPTPTEWFEVVGLDPTDVPGMTEVDRDTTVNGQSGIVYGIFTTDQAVV